MAIKADLTSIELPDAYAKIGAQRLQDVSDALQAASDASLLAAETGTDASQWRRLSIATLTSAISRAAIETIMRVSNVSPSTLLAQLTAAAAINRENAEDASGNTEPEIVASKDASLAAATLIDEVSAEIRAAL